MLTDLVRKNRSFRGFDRTRRVTREELLEFVDLTRFCASSLNRQVLKYHIAYEEKEVMEILSLTGWAMALPDLKLPKEGKEPTAFVVICIDRNIDCRDIFQRDVGICAQTMLLRAVEKGLGGCMLGTFNKVRLRELLGLPENVEPNLVVAFGKPAEGVVLTDVPEDGKTTYYRDQSGNIHYVPKRELEDILI